MSILSFAARDAELTSTNPGQGFAVLGSVPVTTIDEVDSIIAEAKTAQRAWHALGLEGRLEHMRRFRDVVETNAERIAELTTKEMGSPITASRAINDRVIKTFDWLIANAHKALAPCVTFEDDSVQHRIFFEPYGVSGVIVPWNVPLSNFCNGAFQALIAGNTVVYKNAEDVPLFGQLLMELTAQAGWPKHVFTVVTGGVDVGKRLVEGATDMVSFTGSTVVGKEIYKMAGAQFKHAVMELGGSDAGIFCADADLDAVIDTMFRARFGNAGQICRALKRLYVHESRYEEVVARLADYTRAQTLGDPMDTSTVIGPLVNKKQLELIAAQVEDARKKGASVIECGVVPDTLQGAYYAPKILLDVKPNMRAYSEELFGPVLPIWSFRDEDEVIKRANDSEYGLSGYVFTNDPERAERIALSLETGSIAQNSQSCYAPFNPFGGFKNSGMGRTLGLEGFKDSVRSKVVTTEKL